MSNGAESRMRIECSKTCVTVGLLIGLLILMFGLYWPGLGGPFLLDDYSNLLTNPKLLMGELSLAALSEAAASGHGGPLGRPLASLSFALNTWFIGGQWSPWSIKFVNVLLHGLSGIMLFALCRRLLRHLAGEQSTVRQNLTALVITALWLLHPLQVSTVLYAVQRMAILAALFMVAGCLAYVMGREALQQGRMRSAVLGMIIAPLVFAVLAILSKENGALLALYILLIEASCFGFRFTPACGIFCKGVWLPLLLVPLGMLLAYLVYAALTTEGALRGYTPLERLLTQTRVLWFYISEWFYPDVARMGLFHNTPALSRSVLDPPSTLLAIVAHLAAVALALWALQRRGWGLLGFGILWFYVGHLLESTTILLEMVFEHRNYLPSMGLAMVIAGALTGLSYQGILRHSAQALIITVVVITLALGLSERSQHWSSLSRFLVQTLTNQPDSERAWATLAFAYAELKHFDKAIDFYERAAALNREPAGHLLGAYSLTLNATTRLPTEAATRKLEQLLQQGPINPYMGNQLLQMAYRAKHQYRHSAIHLQLVKRLLHAASRNPLWLDRNSHADAFFILAEIQQYLQDDDSVYHYAVQGLALKPDAYDQRLELTRYLIDRQRYNYAQAVLAPIEVNADLDAEQHRRLRWLQQRLREAGQ